MYDRITIRSYKVLLLTCVVKCTTGMPMLWLCLVVQWSVHWALSQKTQVLVLAGARHCALETCGKKKCALHFWAWLNLYIILLGTHSFCSSFIFISSILMFPNTLGIAWTGALFYFFLTLI